MDTVTASTLLRAARRASGLSQADLATRSRTSQPDVSSVESGRRVPTVDTLERLLRQAGHRIIAIPNAGTDVDETAGRIGDAVRDSSRDRALRAFLDLSDSLARAGGTDRVLLTALEPRATGSPAWDAALAGVTDYWLSRSRLPKPAWIRSPSRSLREPSSPQLGPYDVEPDRAEVPAEFLRRNVLIERSTLESV